MENQEITHTRVHDSTRDGLKWTDRVLTSPRLCLKGKGAGEKPRLRWSLCLCGQTEIVVAIVLAFWESEDEARMKKPRLWWRLCLWGRWETFRETEFVEAQEKWK